ncbi:hypothetical protein [Promicromonospora umidemergens]|nr:hypothetical protein [Promicromonospora umidemergens]
MLESQAVTVEEAVDATEAGEEVWFVQSVPLKLIIIDRRLALMPLTSSGDVVGALLVRESTLLDTLLALFENLWDRATPLLLGTSGLTGDVAHQVDDDDNARVLGLMLAGLTDQAVATPRSTAGCVPGPGGASRILRRPAARSRFRRGPDPSAYGAPTT